MKKTLAILLAVLLLASALTIAFAADFDPIETGPICESCGNPHTSYDAATGTIKPFTCKCCAACDYVDEGALTKCARNAEGHYSGFKCCSACTGIFPCLCVENNPECNCAYCGTKAQEQDQGPVEVVPEKAKNIFTNVFSNVMGKLSDVFSRLFELIFGIFGVND